MADVLKKVPVREQDPQERAANFKEVCYGYNGKRLWKRLPAVYTAKMRNVSAAVLSISISRIYCTGKRRQYRSSVSDYQRIQRPAGHLRPGMSRRKVSARGKCIRGVKGEPVSIGKLERFVADWAREQGDSSGSGF